MKKIILAVLAVMAICFSQVSFAAATDLYSFDTPKQQQRFEDLGKQFRCLVCQNESLADSNAPLAKDLRFQVYQMVKQNKTNDEIKQFLMDRYGDFVLFKPRFSFYTAILWIAPFIMLAVALSRLFWLVNRRYKKKPGATNAHHFSQADRKRIRHLLQEY